MNAETFDKLRADLLAEADAIATQKRPGYTQGNSDVLHNFKTSGERAGITPLQAWAVHFEKHASAIMSRAKNPSLAQAEPLISRFADAVNYLCLGLALIEEEAHLHVCEHEWQAREVCGYCGIIGDKPFQVQQDECVHVFSYHSDCGPTKCAICGILRTP